MRIGIDFDDCISQTAQIFFRLLCVRFGKTINFLHDNLYRWEEAFEISTPQLLEAFREIGSRYSFHKQIPLVHGAKQTLAQLKRKGHTLYIVSARTTWELPYSTVWLKYHGILPMITAMIHRPSDVLRWEDYKVEVANDLNLDVFIEDAPANALAVSNAGIPVILFDAPYNRREKFSNNVYRVKEWKEIPKIISKLENQSAKL